MATIPPILFGDQVQVAVIQLFAINERMNTQISQPSFEECSTIYQSFCDMTTKVRNLEKSKLFDENFRDSISTCHEILNEIGDNLHIVFDKLADIIVIESKSLTNSIPLEESSKKIERIRQNIGIFKKMQPHVEEHPKIQLALKNIKQFQSRLSSTPFNSSNSSNSDSWAAFSSMSSSPSTFSSSLDSQLSSSTMSSSTSSDPQLSSSTMSSGSSTFSSTSNSTFSSSSVDLRFFDDICNSRDHKNENPLKQKMIRPSSLISCDDGSTIEIIGSQISEEDIPHFLEKPESTRTKENQNLQRVIEQSRREAGLGDDFDEDLNFLTALAFSMQKQSSNDQNSQVKKDKE